MITNTVKHMSRCILLILHILQFSLLKYVPSSMQLSNCENKTEEGEVNLSADIPRAFLDSSAFQRGSSSFNTLHLPSKKAHIHISDPAFTLNLPTQIYTSAQNSACSCLCPEPSGYMWLCNSSTVHTAQVYLLLQSEYWQWKKRVTPSWIPQRFVPVGRSTKIHLQSIANTMRKLQRSPPRSMSENNSRED